MARHFGAQHTASGYSSMGGSLKRPIIRGGKQRSVAEAIAHAQRVAANMSKSKKK